MRTVRSSHCGGKVKNKCENRLEKREKTFANVVGLAQSLLTEISHGTLELGRTTIFTFVILWEGK
jgi:hypothetical protein